MVLKALQLVFSYRMVLATEIGIMGLDFIFGYSVAELWQTSENSHGCKWVCFRPIRVALHRRVKARVRPLLLWLYIWNKGAVVKQICACLWYTRLGSKYSIQLSETLPYSFTEKLFFTAICNIWKARSVDS